MVRDLGSTNGTIVNGTTLTADRTVAIEDGSVLIIGLTRLRVKLPGTSYPVEPHTQIARI